MTNTLPSNVIGTAYHYTPSRNWRMAQTHRYGDGFLLGHTNLVGGMDNHDFPDWAKKGYIFAFLNEPTPESWKNNTEFPYIWKKVMSHASKNSPEVSLLKFEITEEDDTFVMDWGCVERQTGELLLLPLTPSKEYLARSKDTYLGYLQSRVPVSEYQGQHSLPELVIGNPISLDRIVEMEEFRAC
jgi:hypothetical protein